MENAESEVKMSKSQKSVVKLVLDEVENIENGSITLIFQDETIIQINRSEKFAIAR